MRTHFEVLSLEVQVRGLGFEAYKSSKIPCPRPKTALFFDLLKMAKVMTFFLCLKFHGKFTIFCAKTFFLGDHFHIASLDLASSIPVLDLERVCPWKVGPLPRFRFFFVLGLASCVVDFTTYCGRC